MNDITSPPDLTLGLDRCSTCPIRHRAVCSYSSPQELVNLDDAKYYRDFDAGQEIVGEGEPTKFVGSIVSGVVALHKTLEDGRRQMVGLQFPSDFIGRPMRTTAPYDAVAISPVRMCLFNRRKFETIMAESQALERRLLEMTLDELDAARDWMVLLGRKTARERVASFLHILVQRNANLTHTQIRDGQRIPLPLTREEMAEFLGLTIETVSRNITQLRKLKIIDTPERKAFTVTSAAGLMRLSGNDQMDLPEERDAV